MKTEYRKYYRRGFCTATLISSEPAAGSDVLLDGLSSKIRNRSKILIKITGGVSAQAEFIIYLNKHILYIIEIRYKILINMTYYV